IEPGSICTIRNGTGKFQVVKVLVADDALIHIMIFKNIYDERPAVIGPEDLQLGEPGQSEEEQTGIPHLAMTRAEFDNRIPVVVAYEQGVPEDLKAYEAWNAGDRALGH